MTFEEVYKILYEKHEIVSFDYIDKTIKAKDSITISTFDLFELIEGLKETYAPKIKMTFEQKSKLMIFIYEGELYKEFSKKELMLAWLHPELIEVSDD